MKGLDNWEKAMKGKLEDFAPMPPEGSWDKISTALDGPKKTFPYWMLAVAAAIAFLIGFIFLPGNDIDEGNGDNPEIAFTAQSGLISPGKIDLSDRLMKEETSHGNHPKGQIKKQNQIPLVEEEKLVVDQKDDEGFSPFEDIPTKSPGHLTVSQIDFPRELSVESAKGQEGGTAPLKPIETPMVGEILNGIGNLTPIHSGYDIDNKADQHSETAFVDLKFIQFKRKKTYQH